MSLVAAGSSDEPIQKINAQQIGQALKTVFARLDLLLGPQSPFEYHNSRILRNTARHFSQAVRHQILALDHTSFATTYIMDVLKRWDEVSAQARLNSLMWLDRLARMPRQHFLDALSAFTETRMGLSTLFDQFMKENGVNATIRIDNQEHLTFWNFFNFNFGTISAQKMATDLLQNLEQLETTTHAIHQWISDIEAAMHSNLQDENSVAAFYASLAESPFWSVDCLTELQIDTSKVESVEFELTRSAREYSDTFPNILLDVDGILQDFTTTRAQSKPPKPKVVIRGYTPIPSSVLVGHIDPPRDGTFQISLEGVDKSNDKASRVRMAMHLNAVLRRLQQVAIRCRFYAKDNPEFSMLRCTSECFPQKADDLRKDPRVEPYNCNADLELRCSSVDLLEWRLSRKSSLWAQRSSVIPTEFPFSFNLNHTVDVDVEVEVEFTYQATHHCEKATFSLRAP